ncbi:uncharacterized protein [Phyllobates terribilis]|uniref:uncharacterized protein n=1 Tax=Phyllobates terribilis TaxID=111132 RepID=UPI003CCB4E70
MDLLLFLCGNRSCERVGAENKQPSRKAIKPPSYLSSKRTIPERYPRPLLPQDCKQEEPNVPQDHQGEALTHINTTETYVRGDERCKEDIPTDNRPVCSIMNNVQCAVVSAALLVEEAQCQDEARMVARKRATPWGDAEVRYLIAELDARDYECHEHPGHPVLHKQAVLRRISRGLAQRFGVQRSTTQIRKKLADLRFRSSDRITSIRSQTLPHREIPTLDDLLASQRTLAEAVQQHGVMLARFAAAQQRRGSH